jgi:preprotein translocase subunit SecY
LFSKLLNIFRIPELRTKLLFTVALLCVYRIGFYIPLPGINAAKMGQQAAAGSDSALGALANYMSVFSGGSFSQSTVFGLGIMPYISASIIIQLLGTVVPSIEKLKKEGEPGIRKINDWTRQLTLIVCVIQSALYVHTLATTDSQALLYPAVRGHFYTLFIISNITVLTAGSMFLMWLGEQIDAYGIGNGVSLIITAGIIARMPGSLWYLISNASLRMNGQNGGSLGPGKLAFLACCFVFVVAGSILLTEAQRRIRITQAKHMRGRRVYGGQNQYLPLRVNHGGVMPIIFAQSLMIFPVMGLDWMAKGISPDAQHSWWANTLFFLRDNMASATYLYEVLFCILIFFFSYFWNTVQFQPKEMADQLRDYGSFIPGLRPGKRTAEYLENVMGRITYVGAAFLCVIAVVPTVITMSMLGQSPQAYQASQFFGGTGLLIVISVMLDFVNRIEASLVMRNYSGFMDGGKGGGSTAKVKRPSGGPARRGPVQPQPAAYNTDRPKGLPA